MKTDIILAGVGGQGILSIAAIIGAAAVRQNLFIKQAEVHGMSQRGGAVQSNLRLSDEPIASDLIPLGSADLILSMEPMESLRYLPYLSKTGCIVTSTTPLINIPHYPETENILQEIRKQPNFVAVDADKIATDSGMPRASNMVMLGAASSFLKLPPEVLEASISQYFEKKDSQVIDSNIKAFQAGQDFARNAINK